MKGFSFYSEMVPELLGFWVSAGKKDFPKLMVPEMKILNLSSRKDSRVCDEKKYSQAHKNVLLFLNLWKGSTFPERVPELPAFLDSSSSFKTVLKSSLSLWKASKSLQIVKEIIGYLKEVSAKIMLGLFFKKWFLWGKNGFWFHQKVLELMKMRLNVL